MVDSVKNYGITGVSSTVELGKQGPKIDGSNSSVVSFKDNAGDLEVITIAEGTESSHAVTLSQLNSSTSAKYSFMKFEVAYDSGTIALANVAANTYIHSVVVEKTPGNWVGADANTEITVGDSSNNTRLFTGFDPTVQCSDETDYQYASETTINAYVTAGGASSGSAYITIWYSGGGSSGLIGAGGGGALVVASLILDLDAETPGDSSGTWKSNFVRDRDGSTRTPDFALINTPTLTATSPYYFSFDRASREYAYQGQMQVIDGAPNFSGGPPTSRYVTVLPEMPLYTWTVEAWFRITDTIDAQTEAPMIITEAADLYYDNHINFAMGAIRGAGPGVSAPYDAKICVGFFRRDAGGWKVTEGFTASLNTWYHVVGTFDGSTIKQYVNNSLNSQYSYTGSPPGTTNEGLRIGRYWHNYTSRGDGNFEHPDVTAAEVTGRFFPGDISIVRVYDAALTSSEVTDSWNYNKTRFGY